jgi:glutaminase
LTNANPTGFAAHVCSGNLSYTYGNSMFYFSLMSVVKPFLLLFLLHHHGTEAVLNWVGLQPSDAPFNSLEQLITDRGFPRNPMLNSGAIALADKLPGETATERCIRFCNWLNQQAHCRLRLDEAVLTAVRQSNRDANLALVKAMAAGAVQRPGLALDTYEQICCLSGRVADLAQLGQSLALDNQLVPEHRRLVNAVMLTCGLYEASGLHAARIGVPMKSGVSGALVAVVPRQGAIACYGPALDEVGNSMAGLAFVEQMVQELGLSVFG